MKAFQEFQISLSQRTIASRSKTFTQVKILITQLKRSLFQTHTHTPHRRPSLAFQLHAINEIPPNNFNLPKMFGSTEHNIQMEGVLRY